MARAEKWTDDDLRARMSTLVSTSLCKLLDRGQGALLLSLHVGSFDLALRLLSIQMPERGLAAVSRPLRNELLARRMIRLRSGAAPSSSLTSESPPAAF